jgi:predicted nucleotidyltransferase
MSTPIFSDLLDAMKRAAATLRDEEIPFALAGSLAVYARGGPETTHDVDFVLAPKDADRALEALAEAGFRAERPPEGWLYKVFDDEDSMIDLIFAPNNAPPEVVENIVAHADEIEIYAIRMKVMSATDVLASKLLALREHYVDYEPAIEVARALREQIDWDVLWDRTKDSPYARAFFTLADGLELRPTQP